MSSKSKRHVFFRVFFILFFGVLFLAHSNVPTCWGYTKISDAAAITLDAKNLPLILICQHISNMTGYEIIFKEQLIDEPLTIKMENVTLIEALKKITKKLGIKNLAIVTDEVNHSLKIYTFDGEYSGSIATIKNIGDVSVSPPPQSDLPALNLAEVDAIKQEEHSRKHKKPHKDKIVTPPSWDGKPGLTRAELEAILEKSQQEQKNLSNDAIVTPPSKAGKPGLTRAELEVISEKNRQEQKNISKDAIVTPPSKFGEPGLTRAELEAILEKNEQIKKNLPKDAFVMPQAAMEGQGTTGDNLETSR
jgi:hypothetical protein